MDSEYRVQQYQKGRWASKAVVSSQDDAYTECEKIAAEHGYWRILYYPNGVNDLPVELFDELYMEIGGQRYRAGEYEAWQRWKRA